MKDHSFRDWLDSHKGQGLLYVSWGYWRELHKWPVLGSIWRWQGWLPELWYYIRCRLWHRYNRVTATTLPPTWQDADSLLLHISFAILVNVVEKEDILHHCAWTERDHTGKDAPNIPLEAQFYTLQEIATLYDWWKNLRPLRMEPSEWWSAQCAKENISTGFDFGPTVNGLSRMRDRGTEEQKARRLELLKQSNDMEIAQDAEDTEMLCRLINIRQNLWT